MNVNASYVRFWRWYQKKTLLFCNTKFVWNVSRYQSSDKACYLHFQVLQKLLVFKISAKLLRNTGIQNKIDIYSFQKSGSFKTDVLNGVGIVNGWRKDCMHWMYHRYINPSFWYKNIEHSFNPLNPELNPIYLLALLGAHNFLHISRIRVKSLTLRRLMSYIYIYIYGAPILDVSRSHTTTQHSR